MDRRQREKVIRAAGEKLVAALLADQDLVEQVSHTTIQAQLASGDLVRAEDLRFGQFEMTPIGKVSSLETAIDEALDHLQAGRVKDAQRILLDTIPPEPAEATPAAAAPEPAAEPEPEPEAEPEPGPEPETEKPAVDPAARRRRPKAVVPDPQEGIPAPNRPVNLPKLDRQYDCKGNDEDGDACGAVISGEQAQFSVSRFRTELCPDCLTGWNPRTKKVEYPELAVAPEPAESHA